MARNVIAGVLSLLLWLAAAPLGRAMYGAETPIPVPPLSSVECTVAPVSADVLRAALQPPGPGTPLPEDDSLLHTATAYSAALLPEGDPVDDATVAAVTALELEYAACYNAGEMLRVAALLTGPAQRQFLSFADPASGHPLAPRFATPLPFPATEQIPFVKIAHVRQYPDGSVGALVTWDEDPSWRTASPSHVRFYVEVDGEWRVVAEVPVH